MSEGGFRTGDSQGLRREGHAAADDCDGWGSGLRAIATALPAYPSDISGMLRGSCPVVQILKLRRS